ENLLRVVQNGCGRIEGEIRARFDARAMPALRLIVADHRHVIGENPAEARVHEPCRALLLGRRIRRRLDFEFQTHSPTTRCRNRRDVRRRLCSPGLLERNSHGLSPGLTRLARPRRGAVDYAWPSPAPALQPVSVSAWSPGHAFAEGG